MKHKNKFEYLKNPKILGLSVTIWTFLVWINAMMLPTQQDIQKNSFLSLTLILIGIDSFIVVISYFLKDQNRNFPYLILVFNYLILFIKNPFDNKDVYIGYLFFVIALDLLAAFGIAINLIEYDHFSFKDFFQNKTVTKEIIEKKGTTEVKTTVTSTNKYYFTLTLLGVLMPLLVKLIDKI